MKFHLPFGIRPSEKYFSCISKEEYQELMRFATERGVRLEGFKRFSGDISLIKELIEDVVIVANDFPEILEYVHDNISEYAAAYEDGREFISECFAAYYGNVKNIFAEKFIGKCKERAKEDVQ